MGTEAINKRLGLAMLTALHAGWAPFDMNTNRHRSSAVSMNTHGPEIISLFWFNKGEVHL